MRRSITMSAPVAVGLATAAVLAGGPPVHADIDDFAPVRCSVLDSDLLEVDLQPSGHLKFVYAGDDYPTCDEVIVVTSYASTGPVVDHTFDPVVEQVVFQVAELEAAGPAGVTVTPELDECWAGLEVLRDGDTFLWDHVEGEGCEMEISTEFAGAAFPTEVHVVQQTGAIVPPHIFEHDDDETTVLTGLPNGTWYVKVYEGAQPATTFTVDGTAPVVDSIVHGVADGSSVEIQHPQKPFGVTNVTSPGEPPRTPPVNALPHLGR